MWRVLGTVGEVPRRNRFERPPPPPLGAGLAAVRTESGPDGDWRVRAVPGSAGGKTYRCPGCQQTIAPGTPHLVTWPADDGLTGGQGSDERRHWHTGCWSARLRRR